MTVPMLSESLNQYSGIYIDNWLVDCVSKLFVNRPLGEICAPKLPSEMENH